MQTEAESMDAFLARARRWPMYAPLTFLPSVALAWFLAYQALIPASERLVAALPLLRDTHLASALQFFFYDTPKVLLLLTGIVFVMGMVNSYFTPERTRALLAGLEGWVRDIPSATAAMPTGHVGLAERVEAGGQAVREIVGRVWPYILLGIAVGAGIHGYVPAGFMASFMGKDAWWTVPVAVIVGVPMYAIAASVIPIVQALLAKGAALGTVLAFMMSVIGHSPPEVIILRKVLTPRLIATFVGVVSLGILTVGYVFNALL